MVSAEVIGNESNYGNNVMTITFTVDGIDEVRLRRTFNLLSDDGDISTAMKYLLDIAADSVRIVDMHKDKVA